MTDPASHRALEPDPRPGADPAGRPLAASPSQPGQDGRPLAASPSQPGQDGRPLAEMAAAGSSRLGAVTTPAGPGEAHQDSRPSGPAVAVVVCRDGRLPGGADESAAEAGGQVMVVGPGAQQATESFESATRVWWSGLDAGPAAMAVRLAPVLESVGVVILPASPDGRDLGPRLAAELGRPFWAGAVAVRVGAGQVQADLLRVDGQVTVAVSTDAPVVVTLLPGVRAPAPASRPADHVALELEPVGAGDPRPSDTTGADPEVRPPPPDPEVVALIEPDPATMDLADARRVLAGGAGLVPRQASDAEARALFDLLAEVAATLGASMGATRVATDAGWTGHERQIGTTGVSIDPDLYVALGVSGATQHTGGLGSPDHIVSVNLDASCPMTALADLGLVTDATAFLLRLAERLGVALPPQLAWTRGETDLERPPGASNPDRPPGGTEPDHPRSATPDPSPAAPPEPREETRA